jgi:serpin B
MLKEFIKPNRKKILLTVFFIILAIALLFMGLLLGIPIPGGLTILKIIGLPFLLISMVPYHGAQSLILPVLVVTLFWLYFISCALIFLISKLSTVKWDAKKLIALAIIIMAGFAVYGFINFGWGDVFIPKADDSRATFQGITDVVKANNQFAVNLYSQISKDSNDNIFFSPWSISTAVAMAYEGARGDTANGIRSVFHFPSDDTLRRASFAEILNTINQASGKYKLYTANAIWLQKDYPFLKDYKDIISNYYLGQIKNLDFVNNPVGASSSINNWISKYTSNKIKDMTNPNMFNELTRAVLTNAIYFKGKWEHKFDRRDTQPKDFTLESGEKIKVPMMKLTDEKLHFNYTETDGVQIVEMSYQGSKLSMLVLLPRTNITSTNAYSRFEEEGIEPELSNMTHLESILTEEKLQEWRSKLKPQIVYIYMPKFTFETSYSLTDYLKSMGMNEAFTWPGADFSGMDGTKNLYIDKILHKAYIDVYEEGTEAAAATTISMMAGAAMPRYIEFMADHPFIFIIQESETGNILFIGRVNDPTK